MDLLVGETLIDLALHDALLLMLQLQGTRYLVPGTGTVLEMECYLYYTWTNVIFF